MRPLLVALGAALALVPAARAGLPAAFDDAPLHAVQFIDKDEGWAAGDDGAVWHTINSGKSWERQPTGTRAALRSLHFLTPYTGWAAGREELPNGGGSAGVLLFTRDGGLKWQRVAVNALPGLHKVRFLDNKTGFVAGDGTDQYPSGVFQTSDSGRTWQPLPGPRAPGWLAADFQPGGNGALAGAWNRLAMLSQGKVVLADVDTLGGRNLRGLHLAGKRGVAVGQGGVILLSDDTTTSSWRYAGPNLPTEVLAGWDFHAVHCAGQHLWIVGRPGSVVLHSGNWGETWEVVPTGQSLPLNGIFFLDDKNGWAVGEFGTIVRTEDGGKTWKTQQRGGQRAAVLFVHARPTGLPVDTVATLGGEDGYLTAAVRVAASDPNSAPPSKAGEGQRLAAAMRQTGGAAGELLWQFPLPQHLAQADKADLVKAWDRLHADRAAEQLLRQMVLALRMWRPDVVITDHPDAQVTGSSADAVVAEAVHEAFARAADPKAFPEQITTLGLQPWRPGKLYGRWEGQVGAQVMLDLTEARPRLEASVRDFAAPAASLLADAAVELPRQRAYRLLASKIDGAANHVDLMQGVTLAPQGEARRVLAALTEPEPEILKAIRARRNLGALAEAAPTGGLSDPNKLLAQIGPVLDGLPEDQAAPAAFAVATQYARTGQWSLAREAYLLMVDRYPAYPLAADAYRWLIRHNSSSEARHRHELGQFLVATQVEFRTSDNPAAPRTISPIPPDKSKEEKDAKDGKDKPARLPKIEVHDADVEVRKTQTLQLLASHGDARRWYQGCLEIESRLAAFGPLFANDPAIGLCLQSAKRHLGDFEASRKWCAEFVAKHKDGPWRDAAAAELWLTNRSGSPPKPAAPCRLTAARPFLDGNLDEDCWKGRPMVLRNAAGDTAKDYPTEAWLAYDKDFVYLALRCKHPADRHVPPVKGRGRDADLRAYDRVSLLLDLDRDYASCFHLQMDQRGCVHEECLLDGKGDATWNPRWFVAVKSEPDCWQIEAAIPRIELTGDAITLGRAWACNVVRTLPGRGVQAWSTPADVQPRPEGMGLLVFSDETRTANQKEKPPVNGDGGQ